MQRIDTDLPGVIKLALDLHEDPRGALVELYREGVHRRLGVDRRFVQTNLSISTRDTIRGLHYQFPRMQAKLCGVVSGEVLDVVVDIRRGSPTFGRWMSTVLSEDNRQQVFIPPGFAHGFHVRSDIAYFYYQCDAEYEPDGQCGLRWDDPDLDIDWGCDRPVLSDRDRELPRLGEVPADRLPVCR